MDCIGDRYLASLTTRIKQTGFSQESRLPQAAPPIYIYHKNEKSKPPKMDLPLLKNDITISEPTVKILDTLQ